MDTFYRVAVLALAIFLIPGGAFAADKALGQSAESIRDVTKNSGGKPAELKLREQVINELRNIEALCRRASFKLRRSLKTIKAREGLKDNNPKVKALNELANEYREFAEYINRKRYEASISFHEYTREDLNLLREITKNTLDSMDKMGNFELQELMSRATQARNLAASIKKNMDKMEEGLIQKVGGGSSGSDDQDD
jgi:predicted translin family RNA/ssDNA-binding protein